MGISFRPAVRSGEKLMIGLAGPSGSGKTFSALEIATGLQEVDGGEIFVIDTENRRAAMYAGKFRFMHGELRAPFEPEAYLDAIEEAVRAGAKIVVIDSMSHEHEGEGGILEIHEQVLNRMAGENANFARREALKFSAWIEPKRRHNKMLNRLLQIDAHIVFCFRAKDKLKMVKVEKRNGDSVRIVNEPVSAGWQPIAADRLEYEMTTLLVLPPNAKGRPDLSAEATKIPEPLADMVKEGWQISRGLGVALAEWARGDASRRDDRRQGEGRDRARNQPAADEASDRDAAPDATLSEGSPLERYHRELNGAKNGDDLAARHDGSEAFGQIDERDRRTARDLYKLHLRRTKGLSADAFTAELELLLEGEPA